METNSDRKWLPARIAPWSAHRVVLMSHWSPRWLPWGERIDPQWVGMEADGFVPYPTQFDSPEFRAVATAHARREHASSFSGYRFGESSLRALRDLVNRCRDEHISLAVRRAAGVADVPRLVPPWRVGEWRGATCGP